MARARLTKVVLVVVGLLFLGAAYPLVTVFSQDPAVAMMMSIYITLGVFLLLAARNPASNRSLIAFAGWANLAHAGVMAVQLSRHVIERRELLGVIIFGVIGVVLVAVTAMKQPAKQVSGAGA